MKLYKPVKTAKAMANLADQWWTLRIIRLNMQRELDDIAKQENNAKQALIDSLVNTGSTAIGGLLVSVAHKRTDKPRATDWDAVWQWAKKHDAPDIYQRRLGENAVKERWADGIEIPGVEAFPVDDISYHKL